MASNRFGPLTPGVLPGARTAPPVQDSPQQATVLSVSTKGVVFVLDATPGHSYGPAPWCLGSAATPAAAIAAGFVPLAGDRCLVLFTGLGLAAPWVAAWWRTS